MSDSAMQATWRRVAERVEAVLTRWAADSRLPAFTQPSGKIFLVLDTDGRRVLHASDAATSLRAMLASSDGLVLPKLGLATQVARLGPLSERPKLARLRIDARGIAPAINCLVAQVAFDDSGTALMIAPVGSLAGLRSPSAPETTRKIPPPPETTPMPAAIPAHAIIPLSSRLIWRSDSRGVLTSVSGTSPDVIDALEGRSWLALCSAGLVPGCESAFTALTERRTFRGLSLILEIPESGQETEIDFSGAPSGRPGQLFSGFDGFGRLRSRRARKQAISVAESPAKSGATDEAGLAPAMPRLRQDRTSVEPSNSRGGEPTPLSLAASNSPPPESTLQGRMDLSSNEHDAFREIARALGARFAGDDEPDGPESPDGENRRGSVTPFPSEAVAPLAQRPDFDSTVADALDRLPTGVLVHDGSKIVFVNHWLLDLTGFAGADAVEEAGWLLQLDACVAPTSGGRTIAVAAASGRSIELQTEHSTIDWQGCPAVIVLARLAQGRKARLAGLPTDERQGKRGVITLDSQGRVLALDSDAAVLVAAGRNDVVGEPFVALFPPDSAPQIEESLRQARERAASEPREVQGGSDDAPIPLSLRVARLLLTGETAYRATLERADPAQRDVDEQREPLGHAEALSRRKFDYFAKAGQAIRVPISGILNFAGAMLDEQFGPLGNERYRDYLHDIYGSGEEALSLVNDLVDLAKIDSGRIDLAFADIALNDIVSGCIASIQLQAARERIVVRTSLSPELKTLVADERSMRQATMNVIANAVRLSDPGGQVIVTTTVADRGEIALRVRDTGAGLSADEIEQALDPFKRDTGRLVSRPARAGGLGLTLSKALVEANRGRFTLTSRKNEGTLVEFVFPGPLARTA